jgi:hypothetical protein
VFWRCLPLIALPLIGCATVSREATVAPSVAAHASTHSEVLAVNGVPASGAVVANGDDVDLVNATQRRRLSASDTLTLRTTYRNGDAIPGEGRVRTRPSSAMLLAGSLMLAGGIAGTALTAWEIGLFTSNLSDSPSGMAFMTINGVIAVAGLALVVMGVLPHARVVNPYVTVSAPKLVHGPVLFTF